MAKTKIEYKAPCHNCVFKATCNVLKIYQVVVYECKCLEFQPVQSRQ